MELREEYSGNLGTVNWLTDNSFVMDGVRGREYIVEQFKPISRTINAEGKLEVLEGIGLIRNFDWYGKTAPYMEAHFKFVDGSTLIYVDVREDMIPVRGLGLSMYGDGISYVGNRGTYIPSPAEVRAKEAWEKRTSKWVLPVDVQVQEHEDIDDVYLVKVTHNGETYTAEAEVKSSGCGGCEICDGYVTIALKTLMREGREVTTDEVLYHVEKAIQSHENSKFDY